MKNILNLIFLLLSLQLINSQDRNIEAPISLNLGANFIDSSGDQNAFNIISSFEEKIASGLPIELGISYEISKKIGIFANLSLNTFQEGKDLDGIILNEDLNYWSVDMGMRYYFYVLPFSRDSYIEFYGHGGLGVFNINETSFTGNTGLGARYWINPTFGIYANGSGKFAFDNKIIQSNHFQYSLGIVVRLNAGKYCKCFKKKKDSYQFLNFSLIFSFSIKTSVGITFKNDECCSIPYSIFSTISSIDSFS